MPAARYWRLIGVESYARNGVALSEIQWYDSLGQIGIGVVPTCPYVPVGGDTAYLSDGLTDTPVEWSQDQVARTNFSLLWDFTTPVDITSVRLAGILQAKWVSKLVVQAEVDGTWQTVFSPPWATKFMGPQSYYEINASLSETNILGVVIGGSAPSTYDGHPSFLKRTGATAYDRMDFDHQPWVGFRVIATDGDDYIFRSPGTGDPTMFYRRVREFHSRYTSPFTPGDLKGAVHPNGSLWVVSNQTRIKQAPGVWVVGQTLAFTPTTARFTNDGTKLAIINGASIKVYSVSDTTVTADADPTAITGGTNSWSDIAFSPDGNYLVAVNSGTPSAGNWLVCWKKVDGVFVRLENCFSSVPAAACNGVDFSPDGQHLAVAAGSAVFSKLVGVYKFENDYFTFLVQPGNNLVNNPRTGYHVRYEADGTVLHLTFTSNAEGNHRIFARSGDTYTQPTFTFNNPKGYRGVNDAAQIFAMRWAATSPGLLPQNYQIPPATVGGDAAPQRLSSYPVTGTTALKADASPQRNDMQDGGALTLTGTVKRVGDPDDVPLRRRVRLYNERDRRFIRETWSDAVTGAFAFADLKAGEVYTAFTYDHLNTYRALALDKITGV